jgi:hypothetical protein
MLWLRVREGESELQIVQQTLVDLLPKDYLRRLINVSQARNTKEKCRKRPKDRPIKGKQT